MVTSSNTNLYTPLQFVTTSKTREIKGFGYPLVADGEGGFFPRQTDTKLIQNNIRQLILTEKGERPMQPNFGVRLRSRLFEPLTPLLLSNIKKEIMRTVSQYEERITVGSLDVWEDKESAAKAYNRIRISLSYSLLDLPYYHETLEIFI